MDQEPIASIVLRKAEHIARALHRRREEVVAIGRCTNSGERVRDADGAMRHVVEAMAQSLPHGPVHACVRWLGQRHEPFRRHHCKVDVTDREGAECDAGVTVEELGVHIPALTVEAGSDDIERFA